MLLSKDIITDFNASVLSYGKELYRDMPWRKDTNPYYIFLSEIMLQQTQVPRVIEKFTEFIEHFPTIQDIAHAPFSEVLARWSGLGYNRRAGYVHKTAQGITEQYQGRIPQSIEELTAFPGIGPNTAASIMVYAYNSPEVFIETNIRTVFIYTFYPEITEKISDNEIRDLVSQTIDVANPRVWYWSLMDYGTFLKKTVGNYNKYSTSYTKQSKFEGSHRQKRAMILRFLLQEPLSSCENISEHTGISIDICTAIITELEQEGLIEQTAQGIHIRNTKWS